MPLNQSFRASKATKVLGATKVGFKEQDGEPVDYRPPKPHPKLTKVKKIKDSVGAMGARKALGGSNPY